MERATVANFGERYELIRRIGSGGMGEVWLAHDEQLADRPVAIKIMHQRMLPNEGDVERFEREMRFAAMMDHPNIVTVYTTGTCDDAPFMVMEYLRGNDLEKALPGGDAEQIAGMGRDICTGLAYAHRKGVLHRDIKPSNLFLCESGQVKITDFGLARAVGGSNLTTAGVLVGTFAYMPPERWRGDPPTFSNDIWAVGCVLYRLISGRLPRVLPDPADYAAAAVRGDPIPDLRDITEAPAWLTSPVMAMLAADPASRPAAGDCVRLLSGEQFAVPVPGQRVRRLPRSDQPDRSQRELSPFIGGASGEPSTTSVARPAAGRSRRLDRVTFAIAGVALLLIAGSFTAWRLSASAQPSELVVRARSTTAPPPASPAAAATTPATFASAPRSGPAVASPPDSAPAYPSSPHSASPANSGSPSPARSPSASPASTVTASHTVSPPATSTPPVVPIPDVAGMTFTEARSLLVSDGFKVLGRHTRLGQVVTRTNPSGQALAGSVVIVVYGRGALIAAA
jgi:eukaryotic-like serine/threonine-protein kinase